MLAHKNQLLLFQNNLNGGFKPLGTWNQLGWKYLFPRNEQILQIKAFFPLHKPVVKHLTAQHCFKMFKLSQQLCHFSSVTQSHPTLCGPMNRSTPGLPVHHQLPEFTQTHVHQVSDAIQPSHPLSSPSPPAFNLSQHQGLFQWVSSSYQVTKVLEFQLQHQSFQWTPRSHLL